MARAAGDPVPVMEGGPTPEEPGVKKTRTGATVTEQAGSPAGEPAAATAASTAAATAATAAAAAIQPDGRVTGLGAKGLTFERRWTRPGVHPYDEITWELRTAAIASESGKLVFEQKDVEVPAFWSQLATNVVVSKYFRGHVGTPEREHSVRQLIDRVVSTIAAWAETQHYFATDEDLRTFQAELTHLLVHQKMAFNSPVWFNVGIEAHPQCSACFINSVQDNMGSIMDLAKTEAMLFKFGSGAGSNLSPIRSSRERMSGGGMASGPVSFMKGYDAFAGVIKCLAPDTYIVTADGLLRIDEAIDTAGPDGFEANDSVTLNTPVGPRAISQVYRSPAAPVRRARLRTGLSLTGTLEHPVLTLSKDFRLEWTRLADLKPGARVAVERTRELWPDRAPSLAAIQPPTRQRKRTLGYPAEMTPELARLLGYLVAEGSIEADRFRFSSADPEIMADYLRCVASVFGMDCSGQVRERINARTGVATQTIALSWTGALQFFAHCGLPAGRSADKVVPSVIRRSPRSLVLEFLAAYFEGDAHFGHGRVDFATASDRLLQEIQLLALNLGAVGRRHETNGYLHLTFLGADAARLARLVRPYLVTPRKREAAGVIATDAEAARNPNLDVIPGLVPALRAFAFAGNGWFRAESGETVRSGFGIFNRAGDNVSYARAQGIADLVPKISRLSPTLARTVGTVLDDQYLWDEVVSVTEAGEAKTYDFTVPDVHAFVANGIVSHNSGGKTRRAAKMVILDVGHPDIEDFIACKLNEEKKAWALIEEGYDPSFTGEAYGSVFFQNANHSVRVTDEFMEAVVDDGEWTTHAVTTGEPMGTYRARQLFRQMADAAWVCGDPGIQYDTTINDWNPVSNSARQYATNPCSEFSFINDTSCNLASVNLMTFVRDDGEFDVEAYRYACRLTITAQEIIVDNAGYPTPRIEENSHRFRPLGLGYANLGALLMSRGLAYDSEGGRAFAAALTSVMAAEAYRQSAVIARDHGGPFVEYPRNEGPFLRVIEKHRAEARKIPTRTLPPDLAHAAQTLWDETLDLGRRHGYRNAQTTLLAPTGTIAFMMDCDTTGIEPDIALIKYKKLVGEGFLKIVNNTVPIALRRLGYTPAEVDGIVRYIDERETIEGAPALKPEHLPVFDCAFKPVNGERSIHYMGHVRMMAAVQPFLSGAISKTVNMPEAATPEEIEQVYLEGWRRGLKAIAIYRDNSKRSQPLSTGKKAAKEEVKAAPVAASAPEPKPYRRRLPAERQAVTHKFDIAGHEGYITVGLYPDGQPGEIFVRMAKEGSTVAGLMDSFAISVSLALQYGVPLHDLVNKFAHVRFEPSGFTGNQEIPIAKSIVDYIFRWLGSRFLPPEERATLGLIDRASLTEQSTLGAATIGAAPGDGDEGWTEKATEAAEGRTASGGGPSAEAGPGGPATGEAGSGPTAGSSGGGTGSGSAPAGPSGSAPGGPAATAVGDASRSLGAPPANGNGHANGNGASRGAAKAAIGPLGGFGRDKATFAIQEDAPSCADCGSIMVRNGSCYKCLNCGSTSGCS